MAAKTQSEAVQLLRNVNLVPFIRKALEHGSLKNADVTKAVAEYQQFMLLIWANEQKGSPEMVVPTILADTIWHEHIQFTRNYREFCNDLVGRFIDHVPGLEKGTEKFNKAVEHTRNLQRDTSSAGGVNDTFMPMYLGVCGASTSTKSSPIHDAGGHHDHAPVSSGHHSDGGSHGDGHSSSDSGSSCGGASCGGGGCGGGCGGG
jgi:uncharacterized membrane protein YgcG